MVIITKPLHILLKIKNLIIIVDSVVINVKLVNKIMNV